MRLFEDVTLGAAEPYLARALELASTARGATSPNPLVGCVLVRDGVVVGEGFHARVGEPHAEANALAAAGERARGATAYVTLEPCAHEGRTPPCADALIAAGVSRVVVGMPDPNPEAAGGASRLREAGIEVVFAEDDAPYEELNAGWLHRVRTGMPLVTVKSGLSLDARPAFAAGERASMTGVSGLEVTMRLRGASDAVLVSAATVAADDPALTVREATGELAARQPLRVVLCRKTVPPLDARIFTDGLAPTLVLSVGSEDDACAWEPGHLGTQACSGNGLADGLRSLGERGVGELLVEPGPRLLTALWESDLIDRYVVVTAGGMAGAHAPDLFVGEPDRDGDSLVARMRPVEAGIVGDVSVTVWERSRSAGAA